MKPEIENPEPKVCLTIAGLDPSGGAGIIADVKTFSAFGCFATAAVTSLTFQNTVGVFGAVHQTTESLRGQIEPILSDFKVSAVKTGMLPTEEIITETARIIEKFELGNFVVDPVVRSTSGYDLIDEQALKSLLEKLFPLSLLVTPNIPEAERIARQKIESESDITQVAEKLQKLGAKNVLIKGGHPFAAHETLPPEQKKTSSGSAKDYLFFGNEMHIFEAEWLETTATHGTGCTLAAAITANLANGKNLIESVRLAKNFVTEAIRTAPKIGHGHSPINHLVNIF